jgi:N-acetylmuramoyl-L-alanine amidase
MVLTADRSRGIAFAFLSLLLAVVLLAASAGAAEAGTLRRSVSGSGDGLVAVYTDEPEIYVEAKPLPGEGLYAFARRMCGDAEAAGAIAAANGGEEHLLAGVRYRVPFDALSDEMKVQAVRTLFADDRADAEGWRHRVRGGGTFERGSLWDVARWFTGRGETFGEIRAFNSLDEEELWAGQEVVIPNALLLPGLRSAAPAGSSAGSFSESSPPAVPAMSTAELVAPAAGATNVPYRLEYGEDAAGEFAVYRLKPGEALYSSVVVRFIGAVLAPDVNALAQEVADRSDIEDVTDIPVGHAVKIPFDLLLPEYLPAGHPRRQEYEAGLRESGRFTNQVRTANLAGVTVILDAGHGGVDSGATFGGVWESLYVYDINLRIKRLLEGLTAAEVVVTTRDGSDFRIPERDVLPFSRSHSVLTDPPYPIADTTVGVNLRWYLANSVYRQTVARVRDPQKVVFLSIHADSLHPSIRGAMAYIPGAAMRQGSFRKSGAVYEARREWREEPRVEFSWKERIESEGLSRQLAEEMMASLRRNEVAIHPYKPVREKIIRSRRSEFVPAVLRYNAVPAKVLLEVCNLANDEDRKLLQTRAFRQKVAESVVESILRYYGQGDGFQETLRMAASAGGR